MTNQLLFWSPVNRDAKAKQWMESMEERTMAIASNYKLFTKGDVSEEVINQINNLLVEKYKDNGLLSAVGLRLIGLLNDNPMGIVCDDVVESFVADFSYHMQPYGWTVKEIAKAEGYHYLFEIQ